MNAFMLYLLKSSLCIIIMYAMYAWLLRGKCSFGVCRTTLMFILAASMAIPAMRVEKPNRSPRPVRFEADFFLPRNDAADDVYFKPNRFQKPVRFDAEPVRFDVALVRFVPKIYIAGAVFCLLGFLLSLASVLRLLLTARKATWEGHKLLITSQQINSFTFLRWIVLSEDDYLHDAEAIVTHEAVHRSKAHFIDVCLTDLMTAAYWFNPCIWLLRRELRALHEYEADHNTLNQGLDATNYQLLLIRKAAGAKRFALASGFASTTIKTRLTMMNKKFNSRTLWRTLLFVPLCVALTQVFARPANADEPAMSHADNATSAVVITADLSQQDTVPADRKDAKIHYVNSVGTLDELVAYIEQFSSVISEADISKAKADLREEANNKIMLNGNEITLEDTKKALKAFSNNCLVRYGSTIETSYPMKHSLIDYGAQFRVRTQKKTGELSLYFVVDGKYQPEQTRMLLFKNIKSIETLKSAEAVQRFGEKARNGAVVVTTKNG